MVFSGLQSGSHTPRLTNSCVPWAMVSVTLMFQANHRRTLCRPSLSFVLPPTKHFALQHVPFCCWLYISLDCIYVFWLRFIPDISTIFFFFPTPRRVAPAGARPRRAHGRGAPIISLYMYNDNKRLFYS